MKNNQQYTIEQLEQIILGNIGHYENFEEYAKFNNFDDYEEFKADPFIVDITCGTYNGATQTFTPWAINDNNLINTITQDIKDGDLYETLEDYTEGTMDINYALTYIEFYKVFTIGNRVYVDLD